MYHDTTCQKTRLRLLIFTIATVFLCNSTLTQGANPSQGTFQPKVPKLRLGKVKHDFGDVWQGKKVSCSFDLFNDGGSDLTILKHKTTCGCTVAKPISGSIPPGSKKNMHVSFAAGDRSGRTAKRIILYTNDPTQPKVILTVTANVKQSIEVTPAEFDFGDVAIGTIITKEVKVTRKRGKGPIQVKKMELSSKNISAKVVETTENGCKLAVTLSPTAAATISETLSVIFEDKELARVKLSVKAKVHSQFFVNPGRVFLGLVKPGQQVTRTVTIGAPASDKLEKLSFSGGYNNENVQIVSQPDGGNRYKVQITWAPKEDSKNLLYHLPITVVTSKGIVETIDVPCYGLISR